MNDAVLIGFPPRIEEVPSAGGTEPSGRVATSDRSQTTDARTDVDIRSVSASDAGDVVMSEQAIRAAERGIIAAFDFDSPLPNEKHYGCSS